MTFRFVLPLSSLRVNVKGDSLSSGKTSKPSLLTRQYSAHSSMPFCSSQCLGTMRASDIPDPSTLRLPPLSLPTASIVECLESALFTFPLRLSYLLLFSPSPTSSNPRAPWPSLFIFPVDISVHLSRRSGEPDNRMYAWM